MTSSKTPKPMSFVPLRSAVIAIIAVIIGAVVGSLTFWAGHALPQALLAGLTSAGVAILPLDKLIGR